MMSSSGQATRLPQLSYVKGNYRILPWIAGDERSPNNV